MRSTYPGFFEYLSIKSSPSGGRMKDCRKFLTIILLVVAVSFIACGTKNNIESNKNKKTKTASSGPAGGIVFYDKGSYSDGWRYLEAAPEDQSVSIAWHNLNNVVTGATGTAIGTGKSNTQKIIIAQGNGAYAAMICANYIYGGKNDWFLPSKDELDLMYNNLKKKGIGGLTDRHYWSSSEIDVNFAWAQSFVEGIQFDKSNKEFVLLTCVRAIRAY